VTEDPLTPEKDYIFGHGAYSEVLTNVTDLRGIARMGMCLPEECTQEIIDHFVGTYINMTNNGIAMLPTLGINIDMLIFRNYS
jgi:hypothetical protein